MENKIYEYAKKCRITVFGGIFFRDEEPVLDKTNRPHLGIEFPEGTFCAFKLTSVSKRNKAYSIGKQFYILKDPKAVELDHTYHNLLGEQLGDKLSGCVDLNHTVRMLNNDTPPLKLYHSSDSNRYYSQTKFEVSERDKVGIIKQLYENIRHVRKPQCSETEYQKAEKEILNSGWYHPYYKNVVPKLHLDFRKIEQKNNGLAQ